jgi:hypothetical protein
MTVVAVSDPPVVTMTPSTLAYVSGATPLMPWVSVADIDSANLASASVASWRTTTPARTFSACAAERIDGSFTQQPVS